MKLIDIKCTCGACPSQWECKTDTGHMVYVRFRWGGLTISRSLNPTDDIGDAVSGEVLFSRSLSDGLDGVISWDEVIPHLATAGLSVE